MPDNDLTEATIPAPVPRLALKEHEAAAAIGVPVQTFRELVASGRLARPIQLGKSQVWLPDALRRSLETGHG